MMLLTFRNTSDFFLLLISVVSLEKVVTAKYYHRWLPNTNFETDRNWNDGHTPCARDTVSFPPVAPPVFLATNISVIDIVLPINGELVFGAYASLSFPSNTQSTEVCPGQEVEFNATTPANWLSPDNWCMSNSPTNPCLDPPLPLLDTERVPCTYDSVVFPQDSSFLVTLDRGVEVSITTLLIGKQVFNSKSFKDFLGSDEGRKQLKIQPESIAISGDTCDSPSGCVCGNDQRRILEKICSHHTCTVADCVAPVRPSGNCCQLCGAVLEMDYDIGFKLKTLQTIVDASALRHHEKVKTIVSKLSTDKIQAVFFDDEGGKEAIKAAMSFKDDMFADIEGSRKYGVTSISMQYSGKPPTPSPQTQKTGMTSGSVAALVAAIFLILALIGVGMFCFIDRNRFSTIKSPLRFFKKSSRLIGEFELSGSVAFSDLSVSRNGGNGVRGFDNPIYDTPGNCSKNGRFQDLPLDDTVGLPDSPVIEVSTIGFDHQENSRGFDNPLYTNGGAQLFSDPAYADGSLLMHCNGGQLEADSNI